MTNPQHPILTANFNPRIKTYIFIVVAFFMTVTIIGLPVLLIWLLGLGQHISKRYYQNLKCQLTKRHLEFKKGYLFKVEKTIPLENIQDITFIENPILNFFELRILKVETAGHSNSSGSDMKLIGIIDSSQFKQAVLKQREIMINESKSESGVTNDYNEQTLTLLSDIRDILKDISNK